MNDTNKSGRGFCYLFAALNSNLFNDKLIPVRSNFVTEVTAEKQELIMSCRIGMTTNPGERKRYWEGIHPNLRNWEILERHPTKSAAQAAEKRLANLHNCVSHPGGDGIEHATWCVYKFEY